MLREHQRQGDKRTTIFGPRRHGRKTFEAHIACHDLQSPVRRDRASDRPWSSSRPTSRAPQIFAGVGGRMVSTRCTRRQNEPQRPFAERELRAPVCQTGWSPAGSLATVMLRKMSAPPQPQSRAGESRRPRGQVHGRIDVKRRRCCAEAGRERCEIEKRHNLRIVLRHGTPGSFRGRRRPRWTRCPPASSDRLADNLQRAPLNRYWPAGTSANDGTGHQHRNGLALSGSFERNGRAPSGP